MSYKNFLAGAFAFALAACASSCSDSNSSGSSAGSESNTAAETSEIDAVPVEIEEETEELIPPSPVEASDPNAVTFDDEDFSFVTIISDDENAALGELSIVEVQGNKMLKFTDDMSIDLNGKVQKLSINAAKLIGTENLPKVRSIEFDVYADAVSDLYVNEDGENANAPGYIGGGGGSVMQDEKWYDFQAFEGGEYNFDMSGNVHGQFKFLLADGGKYWSEDMEDANFLIMRWGADNESNLYLDNIVFYDEDGNSIPIIYTAASDSDEAAPSEDTPEEETEGSDESADAE